MSPADPAHDAHSSGRSSASGDAVRVRGERVLGQTVDDQTRCVHYRSPLDVVAIRFHCCGEFYPCYRCHADATDHAPSPWPRSEFGSHAILCGACRTTMTIDAYLDAEECASCGASFNPGCTLHHSIYFE